MNSPRIAVMCSGLGHIARGVETWADSVATELARREMNVTLFKGAGRAQRGFERVVPCVKRSHALAGFVVRNAPKWAWRLGCHQEYDVEQMSFAMAVLPHLIRNRYDLIHLQDPWLGYVLEKTRRLHGARVILGHGTEEATWLLRRFQHVHELTPFYLDRHGDLGDRQWFAVPNFVDTNRFQPGDRRAARDVLGLPQDKFIVLSAAALNRSRKRLHWLIQEFAGANREDALLVLAGARETETADLAMEAKRLLGNRIVILENVPHARMPLLYQAADIHVLCSLNEVMGISIVEAMASGRMNLVHTWGSVEWVVGGTGRVLDMEATGLLARELRSLDRETCIRQGELARKRAIDMFSVEAVVGQMLAMYDAVLRGRGLRKRLVEPATASP